MTIGAVARKGVTIYITRAPRLSGYVLGGCLIPYPMDADRFIDIDTLDDLRAAERLLHARG